MSTEKWTISPSKETKSTVFYKESISRSRDRSAFSIFHSVTHYLSSEYIQNSEEEINQLDHLFKYLHDGVINYFYILAGVVDHFVLMRV